MYGSCDCSIVVLRLGECQRTCIRHVLSRSTRERNRCERSYSRDIGLLSAVGKLYGRVLIDRIRTDDVIEEEQCGFRCSRGFVDQFFVVRQSCENFLAKGKDLFWASKDLEKVYYKMDRKAQ